MNTFLLKGLSALVLCLFLAAAFRARAQTTFYVSNSGNDANSGLSTGAAFKTVKKAYDMIASPGTVTYNIVLLDNGGDIKIAPLDASGFTWTKSGTAAHPINMYSQNCRAVVTRTYDNSIFIIKLENANYINFRNIFFKNVSLGALYMINVDYCTVDYCQFGGVGYVNPTTGGHAVIWLGGNPTTGQKSTGNKISNNLISNIYLNNYYVGSENVKFKTHAIYLSEYAEYNEIFNNTLFDATSYAVHCYHDHHNNNQTSYNVVTQNLVEGVGAPAFALSLEDNEDESTVTNNTISANFVYDLENTVSVTLNGDLPSNNYPSDEDEEAEANSKSDLFYPSDPYWLGYDPVAISYKMAAGDFNGDGYYDDIAGFYDNGAGTTNLHVFRRIPGSPAFLYSGGTGWWYGSAYTASNVTGRVVSGKFNTDARSDIAAFYDYGSGSTQIHVWKSATSGTTFDSPQVWWNTTGYDATKITNRVVSGNFNNDGLSDIAAFYDNGSGNTDLHVWLSSGSSMSYQWSTGWWRVTNGGYNVNKITGRVVSGDFNNDGKTDIAAFYENSTNNCNLHVWLSSGSGFTYQGGSGWWGSTSYDVNKITGRVVAGDYNGDGRSDIAAFYDNGTGGTNLHVWISTGSGFTYQGSTGYWSASRYDANQMTGRVVSADFSRHNTVDDICGFYDYSDFCGSLRTNVWHKGSGSTFTYVNNSLGYPWLTTFVYEKSAPADELPEEMIQTENAHFSLYPNPADESITILLKQADAETTNTATVYDGSGKVLRTLSFMGESTSLDLEALPAGVYFVELNNSNTRSVQKFVKR